MAEFHFRLRDLPTEIRIMVFQQCMLFWNLQRTPPLVVAFRAEPRLYFEAIDAFYSVVQCSVSPTNFENVKLLPSSVLRRLKSLTVLYAFELGTTEWVWNFIALLPDSFLQRCNNLTYLRITTVARYIKEDMSRAWCNFMRSCVTQCAVLSKLILEIPAETFSVSQHHAVPRKFVFNPTMYINLCTGIQHAWVKSEQRGTVALLWDAGYGDTIKWTDTAYFRSIPWSNCGDYFTMLTLYHRIVFWGRVCLQFQGLNPRFLIRSCPVTKCVCHRLVAIKAPVPGLRNDEWVDFTPPFNNSMPSSDDRVQADAIYEIPHRLYISRS